MRLRTLNLRWEPLSIGASPERAGHLVGRMIGVLCNWEGTLYGSGQRCCGVLADCVGAVFGCIDDLDGRPRAQSPTMPPDAALHDPDTSEAALRALRDLYQPVIALASGPVQPFDILVVGPQGGGPSHVMLVGTAPGNLWHCTPGAGFHRGGWTLGSGYEVLHGAFRIGDRERWLR